MTMLTPPRKAISRWRGSAPTSGYIGSPERPTAQAAARSFEVMMMGDTPSPARARRRRARTLDGRLRASKRRSSVEIELRRQPSLDVALKQFQAGGRQVEALR